MPDTPSCHAEAISPAPVGRQDPTVFDCFDRLRFPLIVLVIYIHNASFRVSFAHGHVGPGSEHAARFLVDLVSNGVARIAVPLFFFMSGFLFFHGARLDGRTYRVKLRSRARTLLIPYLFWNGLNFAFYFAAQSNHLTAPWFGGSVPMLASLPFWQMMDVLLGVDTLPIAYQFWFIRDLMVLVVLAPLAWIAARNAGQMAALVLAALWIFLAWPIAVPGIEPALFFYLGSLCAIRQVPILAAKRHWPAFAAVAVIMMVLAALHLSPWMSRLTQCAGVSFGLGATLGCSAALPRYLAEPLVRLSRVSFFTFAVHEPLLQIGRKLLYRALPMTSGLAVAVYLLLPLAIAALTLMLFVAARRTAPHLLALATGKRA